MTHGNGRRTADNANLLKLIKEDLDKYLQRKLNTDITTKSTFKDYCLRNRPGVIDINVSDDQKMIV